MLDQQLFDILACPACQGEVIEEDDRIVCRKCRRKYPVKNGIPVMIVEESEK
jgi:uncharacterized protein